MEKSARILGDYGQSALGLYQTDEGDIVMHIYGEGEMRISGSGGEIQEELLREFSRIIDLANQKTPLVSREILSEKQKNLRYDLEHGCPAQSCGCCDYGSPEGRDGECRMTQEAAELIDLLVASIAKLAHDNAKVSEHLST